MADRRGRTPLRPCHGSRAWGVNEPMRSTRLTGWSVIGLHMALIAVLVAMAVPQLPKIPAQLGSGTAPDWYPWFILVLFAPLVTAAWLAVGLARWRRDQSRLPLVRSDLVVAAFGCSLFLPFLFASDLPIVVIGLAAGGIIAVAVDALGARWAGHRPRSSP